MARIPRPPASLGYLLLFAAAMVVGLELARPFRSASVAFDSQAAVLYFDRIVSGTRLESYISTTPKPLLTVLFGGLHALFGEWRPLAWATVLAYAVGIVLVAALVQRIGGAVAAAFAGLALVDSASLLYDVGFSLATPFALVGWATAGLAITATRPRYAIAGLALALATLARIETGVLIGVAILALAWASWAPARLRGARPPLAAWLVPGIGLLALPVMLVHDLLLTGDPLYWTTVATRFAAATAGPIITPLELARALAFRYWDMGALTVLALLGVVRLADRRGLPLLLGLAGLGPGIAAFLVLLSARGIVVPLRYAAPIDVAVIVAAGLGLESLRLRRPELRSIGAWTAWLRLPTGRATLVLGAAALAIVVAGPYWRVNTVLRPGVQDGIQAAADVDAALPLIRAALADQGSPPAGQPPVLASSTIRPRLIVDLGFSTTAVGGLVADRVDLAGGYPASGQLVLHSRAADPADPAWADLEVNAPTTVGSVTLVPLLADPAAGRWLIAIR